MRRLSLPGLWIGATLLVPYAAIAVQAGSVAVGTGGSQHTCAATTQGEAMCWGANEAGQLGDGTTADRDAPVEVPGLSGVVEVGGGFAFSCARTAAGAVSCWGDNQFGQLGNGTTTASLVPVPVSGLASGAASLAVGASHACARTDTGAVLCWGEGLGGQLGNGAESNSAVPVSVADLGAVVQIWSGGNTTCALEGTGALSCWGMLDFSETNSLPVAIEGVENPLDVGVGDSFDPRICAVVTDGSVLCWSSLVDPELTAVEGVTGATSIALGDRQALVTTTSGAVLSWGVTNPYGQLGRRAGDVNDPAPVENLPAGAIQVSIGRYHSCAVIPGGALYCWGWDPRGQIGDGPDPAPSATPLPVVGLDSGVSAIAAGASEADRARSCAIANGQTWCWGSVVLGDGPYGPYHLPVPVTGLEDGASAIADGSEMTCAVTADDHVKCWGDTFGDLTAVPTTFTGTATAIATGGRHACAVTSAGGITCFGLEWLLDSEGFPYPNYWTHTPYSAGMTAVTAYGNGTPRSCGLSNTGAVACWNQGQAPAPVIGLESGVSAIDAGYDHACALTQTGDVLCWGSNQFGKRGGTSFVPGTSLVAVTGLGGPAVAISLGRHHSCALMSDDRVRCWGSNADLQLGVEGASESAVALEASVEAATAIAAGADHTCAIAPDGAAVCWGANLHGERGDGSNALHVTPMPVAGFGAADVPALDGRWLAVLTAALIGAEALRLRRPRTRVAARLR